MRKGQAALEFLSTYGWAILIILVMIGALSYFGVTNPRQYLPDKCLFKTGLSCSDFVVLDAGGGNMNVLFTLQNDLGQGVSIDSVWLKHRDTTYPTQCDSGTGLPYTAGSGDLINTTCLTIGGNPGVGQTVKVFVNITYTPVQGSYSRSHTGEISTTVQ